MIRTAAALAFSAFLAAAAMAQTMMEFDPVMGGGPPFRRLFLDAMVTEESHGLERVFHAARTYKGNPILRGDAAWEGWGPNLGGTVIRHDGGFACTITASRTTIPRRQHGGIEGRPRLDRRTSARGMDGSRPTTSWRAHRGGKLAFPNRQVGMVAFSNKRLGYSRSLNWTWDREGRAFQFVDVSNGSSTLEEPYVRQWNAATAVTAPAGWCGQTDLANW